MLFMLLWGSHCHSLLFLFALLRRGEAIMPGLPLAPLGPRKLAKRPRSRLVGTYGWRRRLRVAKSKRENEDTTFSTTYASKAVLLLHAQLISSSKSGCKQSPISVQLDTCKKRS